MVNRRSERLLSNCYHVQDPYCLTMVFFKGSLVSELEPARQKRSPIPFSQTMSEIALPLEDRSLQSISTVTRDVSSGTYAIEHISEVTFSTLSMVSSPWKTESWCSLPFLDIPDPEDVELQSIKSDSVSMTTVLPKSATTIGFGTPSVRTFSRTTFTVSPRVPSHVKATANSSWSLETFSSGRTIKPTLVKAKFPWSPTSSYSLSDGYPSSLTTLGTGAKSQELASVSDRPADSEVFNPVVNYALIDIPMHFNIIDTIV